MAIANDPDAVMEPRQLSAIEGLPGVRDSVRGIVDYAHVGVGIAFFAPADGRVGTTIDRYKLLEGRRPDPARADEVLVSFVAVERYGIHVGDKLELGRQTRVGRVVGIAAAPGEFPPQTVGLNPAIFTTPALYRSLVAHVDPGEKPPPQSLLLRLDAGTDVVGFQRAVGRISPDAFVLVQRDLTASTQRSFRLQSLALWLLAGSTALVALLVLSQAVARQVLVDSA